MGKDTQGRLKDREYASEVSQTLRKQQELLKTAAAREATFHTKISSLEDQLRIHRDVIGLVSRGSIDPSDAAEKLALFLEEPDQFEVVKAAIAMGLDQLPSIGAPAADPESSLGEDKDAIHQVLEELEPRLRGGI
jgi:hypothetical protein